MPGLIAAQNPSSHFISQPHSILFQFVLWEFFITCSEITAVKEVFSLFTSSEKTRSEAQMLAFNFISKIDSHRSKLTCLSIKHGPSLNTLYHADGSLDKLRYYLQAFQSVKKENKKQTEAINKHISRCFLNILELEEIIPSQHSPIHAEQKISSKTVRIAKLILDKIEFSTSKIRHQLFLLIQSYGTDEHVLSFLLRHQHLFENSFEKGILLKHINNIFPGGIGQFKSHLHHTFIEKGFKHALPSINNWIDLLLKESGGRVNIEK